MRRAWIREGLDGWIRMNYEASAHGLRKRGWDVQRYKDPETPQVEVQEEDIVHGPIEEVRNAIDLDPHSVVDYPDFEPDYLREKILGRDIWTSTLGEVRGETGIFVKPVKHKEFTGFAAEEEKDWICVKSFDDSLEVYVSELVDFNSEWRVYVGEGEIKKIAHYKGDPEIFPDTTTIRQMMRSWEDSLSAYALDVGVVIPEETYATQGKTCLVEANDMLFAGVYGIDPLPYAKLLEERWEEYWNEI